MSDASVVFTAEMDDKQAQAELKRLEAQIKKLGETLAKDTEKQGGLKEQFEEATKAATETEDRIKKLKAELATLENKTKLGGTMEVSPMEYLEAQTRQNEVKAQLAEQEKLLATQEKTAQRVGDQYAKIGDRVRDTTAKLGEAQQRQGELRQSIAETSKGSKAFEAIGAAVQKVEKRIIGLAKRVFFFSLITKAFRAMVTYISSAIKQNDTAAQAFARLKGALMTLVQPLLNVLIPAFTALANVLTKVVLTVAQFVASLTGSSIAATSAQASALNDEKNALKGVGSEAKKAGKSLASFDEINQLSDNSGGGGGGGGTPNALFDFETATLGMSELLEKMRQVGQDIMQIFGGVKDFIVGIFSGDWQQALDGIMGFVKGVKNLIVHLLEGLDIIVSGIIDAIIERFNLMGTPIGEVLEGIKEMFHGLVEFVAGILTLDLQRIADGVVSIVRGAVKVIEGVFGWLKSLLESAIDWFDEITGGKFHSIIEAIKQGWQGVYDGICQVLDGLVEFVEGVFAGDWEQAWKGVKNLFAGVWNTIVSIIEWGINLIIGGINTLVNLATSALNGIEVPDWVPVIGGKGINLTPKEIPLVTLGRIPALAEGAVIPPNNAFMAMLGDQTSGTNIEAPEAMLRQMAADAAGANTALLQEIIKLMRDGRVLAVDGQTFAELVYRENNKATARHGSSLVSVRSMT